MYIIYKQKILSLNDNAHDILKNVTKIFWKIEKKREVPLQHLYQV